MAAQDALMQGIIDAINKQTVDINYPVVGPLGTGPNYNPTVKTVSLSITRPADSNAYAANDAFSNSTSAPLTGGYQFLNMARSPGGSGTITDAIFSMSTANSLQGELWLFDQPVTNINDNAAFAISDAEALTLVAVIPFNCTDTTSNNAISYVTNIGIGFTCVGASSTLYGLVKVMNAPTPASADVLGIRLKVVN
jgi:hypothetical protein